MRKNRYVDRLVIRIPGTEALLTDRGYEWGSKNLMIDFVKDERLLDDEEIMNDSAKIFVEWLVDNMPYRLFDPFVRELDIYRDNRGRL